MMARGKRFSVHGLYPEDYCFDYDAFEADPENYKFTAEDNAYLNAIELERYEDTVPMTPYERRLLRRWVISGHSVHDNPGSRYICIAGHHPVSDFLDVYRMDREIRAATRGMTPKERAAYLKDYTGWKDDPPDDGDSFLPVNEDEPPF